MNCLEFHRQALTEPSARIDEYRQHALDCADCRRFLEKTDRFERSLRLALEIDVPVGLHSHIKLERTLRRERRRRRRSHRIAVAAGVLSLVTLGGLLTYRVHELSVATEAFEMAALGHVYAEVAYLSNKEVVPLFAVNQVLAPFGGVLDAGFGPVNLASQCPIHGRLGAHLIVPGRVGPVSIIYVPHPQVRDGARFTDRRFQGRVVKIGTGALAIIGEHGEPLHRTSARIAQYLHWLS